MPRRVQTPDGIVEFPDDATDEEISGVLNAIKAPPNVQTSRRSWTDVAVDALPAAGGALGGLIGATAGGFPAIGGAAVGGMVGDALKQAANKLRGAEVPETVPGALGELAGQAALQGGLEAAGAGLVKGVPAVAKAVYRGYLKPSLSAVNLPKAKAIVETAFREGIPVSEGGAREATRRIGALKAEVDRMLTQRPGQTIDLHDIADRVRVWAKGKYFRPGRSTADYDAALEVANRIDQHPSLGNPVQRLGPQPTGLPMANQIKRDLQEGVGPTQYGIPSRAGKTAEKMGAREMRLAIEGEAPEVAAPNLRESQLIDLARSLTRAAGREGNKSPLIGVNTILSGASGLETYRRTGSPASGAAFALGMRVGLMPQVATRAALLAAQMAERTPGTAVADLARAAVQAALEAYQTGDQLHAQEQRQ